jgi:hypothetical protein
MRTGTSSALSVETTLADWHAAQSAVATFNFEAHADEVPRVDARSLSDRDVLAHSGDRPPPRREHGRRAELGCTAR